MTAMRHGHEIGNGEMALAVARVWSGRDSGGIGRPPCRSRPGGGPHMRFGFLNSGSQVCTPVAIGPFMAEEKNYGQHTSDGRTHLDRQRTLEGRLWTDGVGLGW